MGRGHPRREAAADSLDTGVRATTALDREPRDKDDSQGLRHCALSPRLAFRAKLAKAHTHLLQQGEGYPRRVLTVSNDHPRKTVTPHIDMTQVL